MKLISLVFSLLLSVSSYAASVCILAQTGQGMFLGCDGVDLTSTLVNPESANYTDMTINLENLLNQGYRIVGQTDEQTNNTEKLIYTLVK